MVIRLAAFVLMTLGAAGALFAQQRTYLPAEIENGGRVYQANCAGCHGPEGDGGRRHELRHRPPPPGRVRR